MKKGRRASPFLIKILNCQLRLAFCSARCCEQFTGNGGFNMAVNMTQYEKAASLIKREDMVKLLRELVNIKSPFFEEGEIIDYLRGRLSYYNRLETKIHHNRRYNRRNRLLHNS